MKNYQYISPWEVDVYDAALVAEDTEEIKKLFSWLVSNVCAKYEKGIEPDFDQLVASSTVGKMLTMIDCELRALDCPKMTKEERKEMRKLIANNVLYYVYYEA